VLTLTVAACGDADYPRGWTPLRAPADMAGTEGDSTAPRLCPDLAGDYRINEPVIYSNLIERFLSREQREIDWFSATITNAAGDSIHIELARNELRDTIRVGLRERFDCFAGWLSAKWPETLIRTPPDNYDEDRGYRRTLWVARDEDGRLIGREEIVSYRQVAVWCGDGCKYLGIPGTRREEVRWRRMSTTTTADRDGGEALLDSASNARLAREESLLTWGPPPKP
jgi:hypothetical protein